MAGQGHDDLNLETLQEPEGTQDVCSPREKWEKDLTEALLEISEKVLEDEQKSKQGAIGTGWEEAVCGWGPLSASACLHPQKKQKKPKPTAATDCILCQDLCYISDSKDTATETKPSTVTNHKDRSGTETSVTDHVLLPAERDSGSSFTGHCPSPATVSRTETSSVDVASREQRPHKETYRRSASPFPGRSIPICTNCYNTREPLTLNAPLLLPPLKASAGNGHAEQMARRKEILLQQLLQIPPNGFMGSTLMGHVLHNTDLRLDRKLLDALSDLPQELLRVPEPLSSITSCLPNTPVKDAERLQWPYSLLGQKSSAANANAVKHCTSSASVGVLHTRTMQNKRNIRQEVRPLTNTEVRRAKSGTSRVPDTTLPALTITRVELPVRMKLY